MNLWIVGDISMNEMILPLDAFVRSVGVNRKSPHLFFLGAGASISSGIPSAQQCIWEWKRNIFLTRNPGLEAQFNEITLPHVKDRIQSWLDAQGNFPQSGSPDEYSVYIEHCFPISEDRRAFFQNKVVKAKPYVGYQLLCTLAQDGLVDSVWSTNFDQLFNRASENYNLTVVDVGIDCQQRLLRVEKQGEIFYVSLHGDYRYDLLKNTTTELQNQESDLRQGLIERLKNHHCIISGYSGRDESIMTAFRDAISGSTVGTWYWCGYGDEDFNSNIKNLIEFAQKHNKKMYYVPTNGFDDLLVRLARHCCSDDNKKEAENIIQQDIREGRGDRISFELPQWPAASIIKSNAFPIELPSEVLSFNLDSWPEKPWSWLKNETANKAIVAVPFKGKVLALGTIDDIKNLFDGNISGDIERIPISESEIRFDDGAINSLMRRAFLKSIETKAEITNDGNREVYFTQAIDRVSKSGADYLLHESARVSLRLINNKPHIVLMPSIKIVDKNGEEAPKDIAASIRLQELGKQWNKQFNQALNKLREALFGKGSRFIRYEFPPRCGSTFSFNIKQAPIFAEIGDNLQHKSLNACKSIPGHLKTQTGILLQEPELLFCSSSGKGFDRDFHPIRGIFNNHPYDFRLTEKNFSTEIRLAVVCPQKDSSILHNYLWKAVEKIRIQGQRTDYLLDYPGFYKAFGLNLSVPSIGSVEWANCPEPTSRDIQKASYEIARNITQAIDSLKAGSSPNVIIVFIPKRWASFRRYETPTEYFDLHDFVKAYCIQRGISTQFLEEETISKQDQCGIWWWLSLALYVKSMRTPWVLDCLDEDTAFVGLGLGINKSGNKGNQVVLGCSHIYNSKGEGLQYRLGKLDSPVFFGKTPHMSRDDARRTGDTIRRLFYETRHQLPQRVVIHKKTRFLKDEREGLIEGLQGINEIEMLEIQFDSALRYVSSVLKSNGKMEDDLFPVRRGTVVTLDKYSALLWIHGVTTAIHPKRKYYQGKRRIPAPLIIRRHVGSSDLIQIGTELLGLSKMNWNTFDLYSREPATINSSNAIARIGNLLERFGSRSYDFRLIM